MCTILDACTHNGVCVLRVSPVDDDVSLLQVGKKLFDERIDSWAGLDEHHHTAWLLQLTNHLLYTVSTYDLRSWTRK